MAVLPAVGKNGLKYIIYPLTPLEDNLYLIVVTAEHVWSGHPILSIKRYANIAKCEPWIS